VLGFFELGIFREFTQLLLDLLDLNGCAIGNRYTVAEGDSAQLLIASRSERRFPWKKVVAPSRNDRWL